MKLVVDASVALKWFLWDAQIEPNADIALAILRRILSGADEIVQPLHWKPEVLAVLARQRPEKAAEAVDYLDAIKLAGRDRSNHDSSNLVYKRACDLSHRLKQHLFDTLYHAVAIERAATLVTADERYFNAAVQEGSIQLLHRFQAV